MPPSPRSVVTQSNRFCPSSAVTWGKSLRPFGPHLLDHNLELEHHSGYLSLNLLCFKSRSLNDRSGPSLAPNIQWKRKSPVTHTSWAKEPWELLVHQVESLRGSPNSMAAASVEHSSCAWCRAECFMLTCYFILTAVSLQVRTCRLREVDDTPQGA